MSSIFKRISDAFQTDKPRPEPQPVTHRERLKRRKPSEPPREDDDITAQFATAFANLDRTASGTELVKEICQDLTDESTKLKRALSSKE